ncbi:serine-rich repeat 2 [Schistosoma japonicum]|uniref:Serine-rich repeat 2 n=1 Tax=Schistosoma japonicum TaxID=6182 RepID=A0A4Z2DSJ4_SCHJA|nr:serine-rich repeat 2 [Schistosoma japonicum]
MKSQTSFSVRRPSKRSNTSIIGNQSESYISQKITSENEITDCETPTTEFTVADRGSQESIVSYPVQDTYSQLNVNKNLDNSLESREYQSLASVYLNDVAQQNNPMPKQLH